MKVIPFHKMADTSFKKGISYIDTDIFKAISYIEKAKLLNPYNSEYSFSLGMLYFECFEFQKSIDRFKSAMFWNPNMTEGYYWIGKIYLKNKKNSKAARYFTKYLLFDRQFSFKEEVNNYLKDLKYKRTVGKMGKEDVKEQKHTSMIYVLNEYIEQKQYYKAEKYLEAMLYEDPMFIMARNALALVYFYEGKIDEAIYMTYSALRINKKDVCASRNLDIYTRYAMKSQ